MEVIIDIEMMQYYQFVDNEDDSIDDNDYKDNVDDEDDDDYDGDDGNKKNNDVVQQIIRIKKSRIRETKHLSTDADSSTNAIGLGGWTTNTQKPDFFQKQKKSPKTQKLRNV